MTERLSVRRTDGDFPHARRNGVRLLCGATTCTCTCFTILGGAVGGIAGIVTGIVKFVRTPPELDMLPLPAAPAGTATAILVSTIRFMAYAIGYGTVGLLLGAGVGFGIDLVAGIKLF